MIAIDITIRAYQPHERDAILAIGQAVLDDGTTFPFLEIDGVERYWLGASTETFVAIVDDRVVGTYALKPNLPGRGDHVCNAGYMVAPNFRKRGIGRALGEHSLEMARKRGFRAMQYNHVVATNPAVQLWKSLGFRVVGEVPDSFRHPDGKLVPTLVMYREL